MDIEDKRQVLEWLQALAPDVPRRVILHVQPRPASESAPFHPSQFTSRTEFRFALIDRNLAEAARWMAPLVITLRTQNLTVKPLYLNNALIVEGTLDALDRAMSLPEVTSAVPDIGVNLNLSRRSGDVPD